MRLTDIFVKFETVTSFLLLHCHVYEKYAIVLAQKLQYVINLFEFRCKTRRVHHLSLTGPSIAGTALIRQFALQILLLI